MEMMKPKILEEAKKEIEKGITEKNGVKELLAKWKIVLEEAELSDELRQDIKKYCEKGERLVRENEKKIQESELVVWKGCVGGPKKVVVLEGEEITRNGDGEVVGVKYEDEWGGKGVAGMGDVYDIEVREDRERLVDALEEGMKELGRWLVRVVEMDRVEKEKEEMENAEKEMLYNRGMA